jgi:3-methyladenine DNA glycosylase AlkC
MSRPEPGQRRKLDVASETVMLLNAGAAESRTHVEQMVMDCGVLLDAAFPGHGLQLSVIDATPFVSRLRLVGEWLGHRYSRDQLHLQDRCWISDTVRGWLAMSIGMDASLTMADKIHAIQPYARDHHFAVREWAWSALRPTVVDDPVRALRSLTYLASSDNPFDRRFAIESLRPRSVWGRHIPIFKSTPELAENLLAKLRCESHRYVQLSVGNWINDAAGTRPDWVAILAANWRKSCGCANTERIIRRGTRTVFVEG